MSLTSGWLLRHRPVVLTKILKKDRRWEARFIKLLKKTVVVTFRIIPLKKGCCHLTFWISHWKELVLRVRLNPDINWCWVYGCDCLDPVSAAERLEKCPETVVKVILLYFDLRPGPKILFQGDTPEGSDTFQWPVIERDRVGGLRLMIWDKVKVPLCHYSDAPEESNLWTAWQLFPLDDD